MKQVKQAVTDFLDGNSTRIWRKLVLFVFSIFLIGFTTVAGVGGWIINEMYSFPKEYVTKAEFNKYCEITNKMVTVELRRFSEDLKHSRAKDDELLNKYDELLKFLLDKHYKGVNDNARNGSHSVGDGD